MNENNPEPPQPPVTMDPPPADAARSPVPASRLNVGAAAFVPRGESPQAQDRSQPSPPRPENPFPLHPLTPPQSTTPKGFHGFPRNDEQRRPRGGDFQNHPRSGDRPLGSPQQMPSNPEMVPPMFAGNPAFLAMLKNLAAAGMMPPGMPPPNLPPMPPGFPMMPPGFPPMQNPQGPGGPHGIPPLSPGAVGMFPGGMSGMPPLGPGPPPPHMIALLQAAMQQGMPPPSPGAMPPGFSPNQVPSAPPNMPPMMPPSPLAPSPMAVPSPMISVGNAAFVAQRSQTAPKFSCVLLVGVPGVGKTTLGKLVVDSLNADNLGWSFFCGADHIKEGPNKLAQFETTKMVLDGLSERLDALIKKHSDAVKAGTKDPVVRGLLIDKQCRGVEDLYYLNALLRSKGLMLNGIIGIEVASDVALMQRMCTAATQESVFREKLKFHRVVQARIYDAAKSIGLWHTFDGSGAKETLVTPLRTLVLGISSKQPHRQFSAANYHESSCEFVDRYATYNAVMTTLFSLVKPPKGTQFPGLVSYTPLPRSVLTDEKKRLTEYVVRRKVDGVKYLLMYDGAGLFLIPQHMRCVFEMPLDCWLGAPLSAAGRFVLDGELVKLTRERSKEKFVVYDVLYWGEKGSNINLLARGSWNEKQERLKSNLCHESNAFFPKKNECVVIYQSSQELNTLPELLEPCDYQCDGIVFQPVSGRALDPVYLWKPPESTTVIFRLGPLVPTTTAEASTAPPTDAAAPEAAPLEKAGSVDVAAASTTRVFQLEVFDSKAFKHVQFRKDTVEIPASKSHVTIVEGAIVSCGIEFGAGDDTSKISWIFHRTRTEVMVAALKSHVDDLLANCVIPRAAMKAFATSADTQKVRSAFGSALPSTPTGASSAGSAPAPVSYASAAGGGRTSFSTGTVQPPAAIEPPQPAKPIATPANPPPQSDADKLRNLGFHVNVQSFGGAGAKVIQPATAGEALVHLQSLLKTPVSVVSEATAENNRRSTSPPEHETAPPANTKRRDPREERCGQCKNKFDARDGRLDPVPKVWYCFECWADYGFEPCYKCGKFAKGKRFNTRRKVGDFYCNACVEHFTDDEINSIRKVPQKRPEVNPPRASRRERGDRTSSPAVEHSGAESATPPPEAAESNVQPEVAVASEPTPVVNDAPTESAPVEATEQ